MIIPKTCDNNRQRDQQTEFINRVKREQISLKTILGLTIFEIFFEERLAKQEIGRKSLE